MYCELVVLTEHCAHRAGKRSSGRRRSRSESDPVAPRDGFELALELVRTVLCDQFRAQRIT